MNKYDEAEFDISAYTEAFEYFLTGMQTITDELDPAISDILTNICDVLRIAKIRVLLCEKPVMQEQENIHKTISFQKENVSSVLGKTIHEQIGNGSSVTYEVYCDSQAKPWTDIEEEKIELLIHMLFIFHGRIRTQKMVERLTFWDSQFDIPNLNYFMKTTSEKISRHEITNYVACYFNFKHFSAINQQFGREQGTVIMRKFLDKLNELFAEDECLCRIGGDNFIMLFHKEKLDTIKEHLQGTSIICNEETGDQIILSTYAGLYIIPDNADQTPATIMESVSSALSIAKNHPDNSIIFHNNELMENQIMARKIENIFPRALRNREIQVYYQPKFSLEGDYKLVGAEALCRWFYNGRTLSPAEFIPVLERGMEICKLDFYMLDLVCSHIRKWLDEGRPVVKISVNLSRRHLTDMNLLEHIMAIIDRHNVPHKYIEIELTETTTDIEFTDLKRVVNGLQELGVSTSVDDFGIGYSSLNLIRDISWDVLKIDKSFLPENQDMQVSQERKFKMLKHVFAMAQDMNLETIVEGVETPEHVQLLKDNNCYMAQGFYFDKPMPVEEFEHRLDTLRES